MDENIEDWKSMTAQQLMIKKDSIEEEIKFLHDELENVKIKFCLYSCIMTPSDSHRR